MGSWVKFQDYKINLLEQIYDLNYYNMIRRS